MTLASSKRLKRTLTAVVKPLALLSAFVGVSTTAGCLTTPLTELLGKTDGSNVAVNCGVWEPIEYSYDEAKPEESDTLETVRNIRQHNAVYVHFCD